MTTATDPLQLNVEEEELGIYDDKGSGTDLSDCETIKPDENNNTEALRPVSGEKTPIRGSDAADNDYGNNTVLCLQTETEQRLASDGEIENVNTEAVKQSEVETRPATIRFSLSNNRQPAATRRLPNGNTVDPALQIRGILTTPLWGNAVRQASPTKSADPGTVSNTNVEPPDPDCADHHRVNRELLSAAKEIEHVHKKCVGTDTRQRSSYSLRESPLLKTGSSTNPSSARNVYLYQSRPSPMVPLKAWKGYSGNIYFDPIKINRVNSAGGAIETVSSSQSINTAFTKNAKRRRQHTAKPDLSSMAFHCDVPPKPAIIMDKESVLSKENKDIQDDLEWIRNTENVGSLKIEGGPGDSRAKERKFDRRPLCKGSVAHQLARHKRGAGDQLASRHSNQLFRVSGDRFNTPLYMNPLLRASTQYSQSTHRTLTNSPEMSHTAANADRLPPLEQVRASLRGINAVGDSKYQRKGSSNSMSKRVRIVSDDKIPSYVRLTRASAGSNPAMTPAQ